MKRTSRSDVFAFARSNGTHFDFLEHVLLHHMQIVRCHGQPGLGGTLWSRFWREVVVTKSIKSIHKTSGSANMTPCHMRRRLHEATGGRDSRPAKPNLGARLRNEAGETALARLVAIGPDGDLWISPPGGEGKAQPARTTVALGPAQVGREVLVCFAGRTRTAVVVGLVAQPGDQPLSLDGHAVDLVIDRQRIVFDAHQEVLLRCGKASIRLTADGKVVVQGADVVSSAGRMNRIRGGSVKIN